MILCPWKDIARYAPIVPGLQEAIDAIAALPAVEPGVHPLSNGKFSIFFNKSYPVTEGNFEAHKRMLDIQYVVKGEEYMEWAPVDAVTPVVEYSEEKDVQFFSGKGEVVHCPAGYAYIVYPEDAHKPGCCLETPADYVKIVIKLPTSEL